MNEDERRLNEINERVIGCAFEVSNELGCGFLEKVYENALVLALQAGGLRVEQQKRTVIRFRGEVVGEYLADLVVADCVLVEVKAVRAFDGVHSAKCLNYLKAMGLKICLLMNFAKPKVEIKRIVRGL
jgi:GxxExxY protein